MIFEILSPSLANQNEKYHIYANHNKLKQQLRKKLFP